MPEMNVKPDGSAMKESLVAQQDIPETGRSTKENSSDKKDLKNEDKKSALNERERISTKPASDVKKQVERKPSSGKVPKNKGVARTGIGNRSSTQGLFEKT